MVDKERLILEFVDSDRAQLADLVHFRREAGLKNERVRALRESALIVVLVESAIELVLRIWMQENK